MEVTIPSSIELTQRESYSLFDIVVFKSGTVEELESLKKIKIPEISKEEIIQTIKNHKENIFLTLNDNFEVKINKVISREEAVRKVNNYLTTQCSDCIYDIHVTQLPSNPRFEFEFSESLFQGTKGNFLVPLKSKSSNLLGWFSGTWKTYKKAAVLNKWLAQNSRITKEDLKEEIKEITFVSDRLLSSEELIGRVINRALNAGSLITRELLVMEKAIKKGEVVKIFISEGPIEITLSGVAESEGQIGDTIKIKTAAKNLMGKIIEKGQVKIE